MKPGTRVQIKGLLNASMHNGKVGTVTSATTVTIVYPLNWMMISAVMYLL